MTEQTAVAEKPAPKSERELVYVPMGEQKEVRLTINQVRKFLTTPTKAGVVPTDEQVVQFMMLCEARQLNPWVGDAYLVGFDGRDGAQFSLITAVQALLKRAESHPAYDGMEHGVVVREESGAVSFRDGSFVLPEEILLGGWATVYRKDRSRPERAIVNIETYHTHRSRWEADPAGMIEKVAIAASLRRMFPTQTGGLYLHEEFQENGGVDTSVQAPARGLNAITQRLQAQHALPAPNVVDVTATTKPIETRQLEPAKQKAKPAQPTQGTHQGQQEQVPTPQAAPNQYSAQAKAEVAAKKKSKSKATGSQMEFPGPAAAAAAPAKPVAPPAPMPVAAPEPVDEYAPVADDEEPLLEGESPQEETQDAGDPLAINWNTLLSYPPDAGDQDDVIIAGEYRNYIRGVTEDRKLGKIDRCGKLSSAFANMCAEIEGSWGIGALKRLKQIGTEMINSQ